jgi:hypothetical protein
VAVLAFDFLSFFRSVLPFEFRTVVAAAVRAGRRTTADRMMSRIRLFRFFFDFFAIG